MFLSLLWQASWQGAVLVGLVAVSLRIVPSIHPKAKAWLWRLVFLKFAIGLFPFSGVMLKVLPPQQAVSQSAQTEALPIPPQPQTQADPLFIAWAIGACALGVYGASCAAFCRRKFLKGQPACEDLIKEASTVATRFGKSTSPRLLISPSAETAMVTGCLRPTIILPPDLDGHGDLQMVLAHEMAHVAHRDLEWSSFASLVQTVFFFHPLVWFAYRQLRSAQESAADFAAIKTVEASPRSYGDMLLRLSLEPTLSPYPGLAVRGSVRDLKKRLIELTHVQQRPRIATVTSAVVLLSGTAAMLPAYCLADRDALVKSDLVENSIPRPHEETHPLELPRHESPMQGSSSKAPRQKALSPRAKQSVSNRKVELRKAAIAPVKGPVQRILPVQHSLAPVATVGSGSGSGSGQGSGGSDPISSSSSSSFSSSSSGSKPGSYRYSYGYDHSYEFSDAAKGIHIARSTSVREKIGPVFGDKSPPGKDGSDDL